MSRRERKSAEDRKAEIVETAIRLAAKIGPDRLTTDLLAKEIGVTQPAIFRHFAKKEDIWSAVAERIAVFLDVREEIGKDLSDGVEAQLISLVRRHLTFVSRNPAIPAILFSRELHAENETLRQFFERIMDNRQSVFEAIVQVGIEQGALRPTLDAREASALFMSLIQGLAMRWSLSGRSFDLVQEGEALSRLLISGFYPKAGVSGP